MSSTSAKSSKVTQREAMLEGLSKEWRVQFSMSRKQYYYFNTKTGESVWQKPKETVLKTICMSHKKEYAAIKPSTGSVRADDVTNRSSSDGAEAKKKNSTQLNPSKRKCSPTMNTSPVKKDKKTSPKKYGRNSSPKKYGSNSNSMKYDAKVYPTKHCSEPSSKKYDNKTSPRKKRKKEKEREGNEHEKKLNSPDSYSFSPKGKTPSEEIVEVDTMGKIGDGASLEHLYIVVDTNVLLHDLHFIKNLRTKAFKGNKIVIYVPWQVLQELDDMKNNKKKQSDKITKDAKVAVSYLYDLMMKEDASLKAEKAIEADSQKIVVHTADDFILSCCLKLKEANHQLLLLSNDKNLLVKAKANNIHGYTMWTFPESDLSTTIQPLGKQIELTNKDVNKGFDEIKALWLKHMSQVAEHELQESYGKVWKTVSKWKPPWSVKTMLLLLDHYWFPVFELELKDVHRPVKMLTDKLKHLFTHTEEKSLRVATETVAELFLVLSKLSRYNDNMMNGLQSIREQFSSSSTSREEPTSSTWKQATPRSSNLRRQPSSGRSTSLPKQPVEQPTLRRPCTKYESPRSSSFNLPCDRDVSPPKSALSVSLPVGSTETKTCVEAGQQVIFDWISLIYDNLCKFTGQIMECFGLSHPYLQCLPLPHVEECKLFLPKLHEASLKILEDLKTLFMDSPFLLTVSSPNLLTFYSTISNFDSLLCIPFYCTCPRFSIEDLLKFFKISQLRAKMYLGQLQLEELVNNQKLAIEKILHS